MALYARVWHQVQDFFSCHFVHFPQICHRCFPGAELGEIVPFYRCYPWWKPANSGDERDRPPADWQYWQATRRAVDVATLPESHEGVPDLDGAAMVAAAFV